MHIVAIILQVILGLGFIMFGIMKFTAKEMVEGFEHFGLPQWLRVVTGILELLGAAALIIGIWVPILAIIGGVGLAIIMFFAALTHIRAKDPIQQAFMPTLLLILSVVVAILN
ncbi:MAG TPA: DoxX family protein [Cerasibacillus sp.]|uniref:DoxX family protein n=1 Tax=Cerasibacillus sp. TaxID=2498711 RepID=UPI002F4164B8